MTWSQLTQKPHQGIKTRRAQISPRKCNASRWRHRENPRLTSPNSDLVLPGQYYDQETGLHYNYFRDYDPVIGRYVQGDPIGLKGGTNVYEYVNNQPLGLIDPYGLVRWDGHIQIAQLGYRIKIGWAKTDLALFTDIKLILKSECINHQQVFVTVDVDDIEGIQFSLWPLFLLLDGDVTLYDSNSTPEPHALTTSFSLKGTTTGVGGGEVKAGIATGVYKGPGLVGNFNVTGKSSILPPETKCCN